MVAAELDGGKADTDAEAAAVRVGCSGVKGGLDGDIAHTDGKIFAGSSALHLLRIILASNTCGVNDCAEGCTVLLCSCYPLADLGEGLVDVFVELHNVSLCFGG